MTRPKITPGDQLTLRRIFPAFQATTEMLPLYSSLSQALRPTGMSPCLDPAIFHESLVLVHLGGCFDAFDPFFSPPISWGSRSLLEQVCDVSLPIFPQNIFPIINGLDRCGDKAKLLIIGKTNMAYLFQKRSGSL